MGFPYASSKSNSSGMYYIQSHVPCFTNIWKSHQWCPYLLQYALAVLHVVHSSMTFDIYSHYERRDDDLHQTSWCLARERWLTTVAISTGAYLACPCLSCPSKETKQRDSLPRPFVLSLVFMFGVLRISKIKFHCLLAN
jgi:hypothetical protein